MPKQTNAPNKISVFRRLSNAIFILSQSIISADWGLLFKKLLTKESEHVEGFTPEKGDDAKEVYWVKPEDFPSVMAFDHRKILNDYLSRKKVRL